MVLETVFVPSEPEVGRGFRFVIERGYREEFFLDGNQLGIVLAFLIKRADALHKIQAELFVSGLGEDGFVILKRGISLTLLGVDFGAIKEKGGFLLGPRVSAKEGGDGNHCFHEG